MHQQRIIDLQWCKSPQTPEAGSGGIKSTDRLPPVFSSVYGANHRWLAPFRSLAPRQTGTIGRNCRSLVMLGGLRRLPWFPCVHKRCLRISKLSLVGIGCCLLSSGRNHVMTSAARFMEELTSVGLGCLKKIVSDQRVRCFDPPTKTVVSSISTDAS